LTANYEWFGVLADLSLVEKDIFGDIGGFVGGVIDDVIGGADDILGGGIDLFTALFRWLGKLFSDVISAGVELIVVAVAAIGDAITAAINAVGTALESAIDLVTAAINAVGTALESAIDLVTDAVDSMSSYLGNLLDDIIAAVVDLASETIDYLISIMGDVMDAVITALSSLLSDIVAFLLDAFDALLSAVGLDGLGSSVATIFSDLIDNFINILILIPEMIIFVYDVINYIGFYLLPVLWAYVLILSIFENDNMMSWFGGILEKLDSGFPEFSVLGFSISIKLYMILIPLTIVEVNAI